MDINEYINYETKELKCGVCGKWFKPISREQFNNLVSKSKRLNRLFYCSDTCKRLKNGSIKVLCDNCGKEIMIKQSAKKEHNFCCRNCWKEYLKREHQSLQGEERECLYCHKAFTVSKNCKGKYCSNECQHNDIAKHNDDIIENGYNVSHRILKRYLMNKHGRCMNPNCKWDWSSDEKPILELHHIDGNHLNNTLDNCILLCPNCHSLTDNYKYKKSHKSTRDRRKYYKK